MNECSSDPLVELDAMKKVAQALSGLNEDSIRRVIRWAADHYAVSRAFANRESSLVEAHETRQSTPNSTKPDFDDIADLYAVTSPSSDPEKALVIAYWFQVVKGRPDFDSQNINKELKQLGHGVSNITVAFNSLIRRKPALLIQTRKSGTSQQARKKYKLTTAGEAAVSRMMDAG